MTELNLLMAAIADYNYFLFHASYYFYGQTNRSNRKLHFYPCGMSQWHF